MREIRDVRCYIYGRAVPHTTTIVKGKIRLLKEYAEWKKYGKEVIAYQMSGREPIGGYEYKKVPIKIFLRFDFAEHNLDDNTYWMTKAPDIDNLTKGLLDICKGIIFKDDSQVSVLDVRKRIIPNHYRPVVFIVVSELEDEPDG